MDRQLFCSIAVSALLMASIAVAGFAQDVVNGTDWHEEQQTRYLINSGVRVDDEASLIQALKNKDVEIAFWAQSCCDSKILPTIH